MTLDNISWLHVEPTSRCNAWCPSCPRNKNGFGLTQGLIEQDLDISHFEQTLGKLPNLQTVQLCGNYGDPLANNDIDRFVDLVIARGLRLQIHTNGSLRSSSFWHNLGKRLANLDHAVWFGIDGIGEVHSLYRQATDYNKIISNAETFIKAGGHAVWQFIPFEHNQHQIRDCMRLSQQLGFQSFKVIKTFRTGVTLARNWRTGEAYNLVPATVYKPVNFVVKSGVVQTQDCMHLNINSVYLSASGHFSPCCYFSERRKYSQLEELVSKENIALELDTPHNICISNCGQ
jgi:MoaA/NifB/PqqE/SkfB family radical SAM enzyme